MKLYILLLFFYVFRRLNVSVSFPFNFRVHNIIHVKKRYRKKIGLTFDNFSCHVADPVPPADTHAEESGRTVLLSIAPPSQGLWDHYEVSAAIFGSQLVETALIVNQSETSVSMTLDKFDTLYSLEVYSISQCGDKSETSAVTTLRTGYFFRKFCFLNLNRLKSK